MKFQFQTTIRKCAEDSKWGGWIYQTDDKRKVGNGVMIVLSALFITATVFTSVAWDGDWLLMGVPTLCMVGLSIIVILQNKNWSSWKKQFIEVDKMRFEREDGELTIELTEEGSTLYWPDETVQFFPWKNVEAIREWSEGWDIIDKPGFSGISLRREDITVGDAQSVSEFIQKQSKKRIAPRAIELEELKRRYKIS